MDVVFGSEEGSTSKSDGGVYDEDMDDDQRARLKRRETVQSLLEEQEKVFRADRKRKQWGKFANITNKEELEPLLQEELQKVEQGRLLCIKDENIGKRAGVMLMVCPVPLSPSSLLSTLYLSNHLLYRK